MLTAERVEAVMLAAAQDALVAIPDWTGGFRVPVSRWLTGLSETIEHGAAATDEQHGALALANLILRGPYRAGREDAAREIAAAIERAVDAGAWVGADQMGGRAAAVGAYGHAARLARMYRVPDCGDEREGCSCPDCDVTAVNDLPGSRTVKGLDARCPVHGPAISLGRSVQGDGDSPEEGQRP